MTNKNINSRAELFEEKMFDYLYLARKKIRKRINWRSTIFVFNNKSNRIFNLSCEKFRANRGIILFVTFILYNLCKYVQVR